MPVNGNRTDPMPLELDDREPPEDDPDAPEPAQTVLRGRPVRNIDGDAIAVAGPCADHPAEAIWLSEGKRASETPAPASVPERVCFLMRARRDLGARVKDSGTNGLR